MSAQTFELLTRDKIDVEKWNQAVKLSPAPIYLYSWFLDAMKTSWLAIVATGHAGHYTSIVPLQIQNQFGVTFICQNPFFPCSGVYTIHRNDPGAFRQFVERSIQKFSYVQKLIYRHQYFPVMQEYQQKMVLNYRLEIQQNFDQNLKRFSSNRKRNLRTAVKHGLAFFENTNIEAYIRYHDEFLSRKIPGFEAHQYKELRALFTAAQTRRKSVIAWVFQNDQAVAAAILLFEKDTIAYFSAATSQRGRKLGASTFLICEVLRKYRGSYKYFDFNGGWDVPALNRFYAGFGATHEQLVIARRVAFPEPFRTLFLVRSRLKKALQNLKLFCTRRDLHALGLSTNSRHSS